MRGAIFFFGFDLRFRANSFIAEWFNFGRRHIRCSQRY